MRWCLSVTIILGAGVLLFQIPAAAHPSAVRLVFGLAAGYVAASVSESWCHRRFGHMAPRLRMLARRLPILLGWLRVICFFHHVVHHRATYCEGFTVQFRDTGERGRLLRRLSPILRPQATATDFGTTITLSSFPFFMGPGAALICPLVLIAPDSACAASLMLFLPPLLSMYLHPLMHRRHEDAIFAGGVSGWLMTTASVRWILRHHWMHHKYESVNFNLLPGGDYLLGTHRSPSTADLQEMSRDGIPVPAASTRKP
jgi:hypothetical protein